VKILNFILVLFIVSIFSGCSVNKLEPKNSFNNNQIEISTNSEEDDLLDEFADEMEVEEVYDPLKSYNRFMTGTNDNLYIYVLKPVSNGYKAVVNKEIRLSVKNFFRNIGYPIRLINNLLQGKFSNATEETGRFLINSTVGLLGLFDPAKTHFELEAHNEDFGQTLGFYGVGAGPHIVLPIFGPSNLRDVFATYPDSSLNPIYYNEDRGYNLVNHFDKSIALKAYKTVNNTSLSGDSYDKMKQDAVDLYPYLRDVYEQHRNKQIEE